MEHSLRILLGDAPVDGHVRLHTEGDGSDVPSVRYLTRQGFPRRPTPGGEEALVEFAGMEITIRALPEHVEIVLRPRPPARPVAAAAA